MANVVIQSNNSTVSNLALVSKSKWKFNTLQSIFLLPNAAYLDDVHRITTKHNLDWDQKTINIGEHNGS